MGKFTSTKFETGRKCQTGFDIWFTISLFSFLKCLYLESFIYQPDKQNQDLEGPLVAAFPAVIRASLLSTS